MAIDFGNGQFNRIQETLKEDEVLLTVRGLKPVKAAYIGIEDLGVDPQRRLWINANANVFSATEAVARALDEEEPMCRIIALPWMRIVDLSAGDFVLGGETGSKLGIDAVTKFTNANWVRATGILRLPEQRAFVQEQVAKTYGTFIGESVLAIEAPFNATGDLSEELEA